MFTNHAETAPDHPDRRLRDRTYSVPTEVVVKALRDAASERRRWRFIRFDPAAGEVHLEHDTPIITFTDDIVLTLKEEKGKTTVSGRSRARLGKWDLGVNARNLRVILAALDKRAQGA